MSALRKTVLQSILANVLFSCSPRRVIVFPINVKASTCIVSRMIPVSINIINLPEVFNIQAVVHLNKEQLQIMKCLAQHSKNTGIFSCELLNHFNQLDVQKLDVVCFFETGCEFSQNTLARDSLRRPQLVQSLVFKQQV